VDPYLAIGPGGGSILEIPPLTARLLGANWPVGGGGYLRLLPLGLIAATLANRRRQGRPAMIYLHPWELDPDQPLLPTSRFGRMRHRLGMHSTARKLAGLLRRFSFTAVRPLLPQLCRQAQAHSFRLGG